MGASFWGKRPWDQTELSVPPPTSREEREAGDWVQAPVINDVTNYAYGMTPWLKKHLNHSFLDSEQLMYQLGGTAWLYRDRNSCTLDPSRPCPVHLFIWLFNCILYNKMLIISVELSWGLWVLLANHWTWGWFGELLNRSFYYTDKINSARSLEVADWHLTKPQYILTVTIKPLSKYLVIFLFML